jgi:hypothetical protein
MGKQSNGRAAKQFVQALSAPAPGSSPTPPFFTATVTAVSKSTGTISVQLPTDTAATPGVNFVGSYWPTVGDTVILAAQGPHWFALGGIFTGIANLPLLGNGVNQNIVSGGADRVKSAPFHFFDSAAITISSGKWSYDTTGRGVPASGFSGCGSFHVTPGSEANSLGFLTILASSCSVSGGILTLGGFAQNYNAANIGSGSIQVNVSAIGW